MGVILILFQEEVARFFSRRRCGKMPLDSRGREKNLHRGPGRVFSAPHHVSRVEIVASPFPCDDPGVSIVAERSLNARPAAVRGWI
jgi:hypothetical protein